MRTIQLNVSTQKNFPKRVVPIHFGLGQTQQEKSYEGIPLDKVRRCICRQLTDKLCGPAAIETLLYLHGLSISQWEIAEKLYKIGAFREPFWGTHPDHITRYLNSLDGVQAWQCNQSPTSPDLLYELVRQQPVLASWWPPGNRDGGEHAVVIVGINGCVPKPIVVVDPSPSEFEEQTGLIEADRLKYWPISELKRISTYWRVRVTRQ